MNPALPCSPNILVMHPDPLVRAGIVASLREHADFEVFADGTDAAGPDGHPIDVVIADYHQAIRLTDAAARAARRSLATARILALTSREREADIRRAIQAGVDGYLLLGGPLSELIECATALAHGGRYLSRSAAQRMADSLTREALTAREIEVLELLVAGECNKSIARQLHIGVGTVKSHVNAILAKLNATSRTQAAAVAVTRGLVEERMPIPPGSSSVRVHRLEPMAQPA
ncbi:response regulator transcription factor [Piscinibacter sp. XHJ-5]|uniref:response regulator transcription factor n=1 Tax=Piscinibacter sp. XHJ-5 TaxID=3037797 RepID=UPI0024529B47|nr:response regulator transcription factor [Piscinibacter sp. XHJ-5]